MSGFDLLFAAAGNVGGGRIATLTDTVNSTTLYSVQVDGAGNIYAVGGAKSPQKCLLVKYNSLGELQWQKTLGNASAWYFQKLVFGVGGTLYVIGSVTVSPYTILITKYSAAGELIWQRGLNPANSMSNKGCIVCDSSDNVYIGGGGDAGAGYSSLLAKYNASGVLQWQKTLGPVDNRLYFYSMAISSTGDIYGLSSTAPINRIVLVKYNSSGVLQWQKTLGGATAFSARCVAVDASGNIYVAATSQATTTVGLLAKYNASGVLQWQRQLSAAQGVGMVSSIAFDSFGNVYCVGYRIATYQTVVIVVFNTFGTLQWQRELPYATSGCTGFAIGVASDTTVVLTGVTNANKLAFVAMFPIDGSGARSYGSFGYSSAALSVSTPTYTETTPTYTDVTASNTETAVTLTEGVCDLTAALIN